MSRISLMGNNIDPGFAMDTPNAPFDPGFNYNTGINPAYVQDRKRYEVPVEGEGNAKVSSSTVTIPENESTGTNFDVVDDTEEPEKNILAPALVIGSGAVLAYLMFKG